METPCPLLLATGGGAPATQNEIRKKLETSDDYTKMEGMKQLIESMLAGGEQMDLLMTVIRFVLPTRDKALKRLLLFYFEMVPKHEPDGTLRREFILVCNAWMQDLNHPNEYVRGATLRFLCRIKEPDLLETLVPSVKTCMEHRHSYVRRNAVMALMSIYQTLPDLVPDAAELLVDLLGTEQDESVQRNAFLALTACDQARAIGHLAADIDSVGGYKGSLQLAVIELIRTVYRSSPGERSKYIKVISTLLESEAAAVRYEAAITLILLSSAATAVRAAAGTFVELAVSSADNNVKLIVLDRLALLKTRHARVLQDILMDMLRALGSPNLDIRKKTLDICMDLVTPRNITQVIGMLKKEVARTQAETDEARAEKYRRILIRAIHSMAINFPDVAADVIDLLMDFVSDASASAADVMVFVREVVHSNPHLRIPVLRKLMDMFGAIHSSEVMRGALWIIGEYATSAEDVSEAFKSIRATLGDIPFVKAPAGGDDASTDGADGADGAAAVSSAQASGPKLNADGTYATQSSYSESASGTNSAAASEMSLHPLRDLLLRGDYYLGSVLATTLTKLVFKARDIIKDAKRANIITAEIMLIFNSLLQLDVPTHGMPVDPDAYARISFCLRVLANPTPVLKELFLKVSGATFAALLEAKATAAEEAAALTSKAKKVIDVHVDDTIQIPQLRGRSGGDVVFDDDLSVDIYRATGKAESASDNKLALDRVYQLTGFSDAVYAEAYLNIHQYDIELKVLIVNQTADTLTNLTLELATLGDLKVVERPTALTIGPHDFRTIRANLKVSSTETAIVFGNVTYDVAGASSNDTHCIVLESISLDILSYVAPATVPMPEFRTMWAEFSWENRVNLSASFSSLPKFLDHIIASTNMACLTPASALEGDCDFLAANLYAESIFGEKVLAQASLERLEDGKVGGYVRIRSVTQGIALSLGDRITMKQRSG